MHAPNQVVLTGWYAEAGNITELECLPHGTILTIKLKSPRAGTPDASTHPIARLPLVVPKSFTTCYVRTADLKQSEVEQLVYGAPGNRTAACPLHFNVTGYEYDWINKVKAQLRERCGYRHVYLWKWAGP